MKRLLFIAFPALVGTAACGDDGFGQGIRRPTTEVAERPTILSLAITEVFFGDGTEPAFVEILNEGGTTEALGAGRGDEVPGPLQLVSTLGQEVLGGSLDPDERLAIEIDAATFLPTGSGEIALTDANGTVHSYVAWGGDPGPLPSSLYTGAFASALVLPAPPQLATAYPVDISQALIFEGARGCAAPTPGEVAAGVTDCATGGTGDLQITEVYVGESIATWVEVYNPTDAALPLEGVRFCQPPACAPVRLATDAVPAMGYAILFLGFNLDQIAEIEDDEPGRLGLGVGVRFRCGLDTVCGEVPTSAIQSSDELALGRPGGRAARADELFDYLRINNDASTVLEDDAIAAGLWLGGAIDGDPGLDRSYQRLQEIVEPGPTAWRVAATTPGAPFE